jgi:hypothetical protein
MRVEARVPAAGTVLLTPLWRLVCRPNSNLMQSFQIADLKRSIACAAQDNAPGSLRSEWNATNNEIDAWQ